MRAIPSCAWLALWGCAATVPETEYKRAISTQAERYELEIEHQRQSLRDLELRSKREREDAEQASLRGKDRTARLEEALTDKQRLLDNALAARPEPKPRMGFDRRAVLEKIEEQLGPEGRSLIEPIERGGALILRAPADRFFSRGSPVLREDGKSLIEKLLLPIGLLPTLRVQFELHGDPMPNAWEVTAKQGLALIRAAGDLGFDPSRLSLVAFGAARPIAPNSSEADRAKNRRLELRIGVIEP
jgi:chemotaxis protein MotB